MGLPSGRHRPLGVVRWRPIERFFLDFDPGAVVGGPRKNVVVAVAAAQHVVAGQTIERVVGTAAEEVVFFRRAGEGVGFLGAEHQVVVGQRPSGGELLQEVEFALVSVATVCGPCVGGGLGAENAANDGATRMGS